MARALRIHAPGLTYHVMARGTGRMTIYRDDIDRRRFLALLGALSRAHGLSCHAYCLMSNHYHLVVTTLRGNLPRTMRQLNGIYAQKWNARHAHVGHVFQGRYVAQLVQDGSYFLTVCAYVALNPVRAGLVPSPDRWAWSSYRATVGACPAPTFLTRDTLLRQFGAHAGRAERLYREYVHARIGADRLPRRRILGDADFARAYASEAAAASPEVPGAERLEAQPLADFFGPGVTRRARNAGMVAAHAAGHTQQAIARHLGLHYGTVSRVIGAGTEGARS